MIPPIRSAPSLGRGADYYLDSHGYTLDAICNIARIYQMSSSITDFAGQLAAEGMPLLEAEYLFSII
jgi:hypothetical protein